MTINKSLDMPKNRSPKSIRFENAQASNAIQEHTTVVYPNV